MAAGDGLADIVGRRFGGRHKWPIFDGRKSYAGTLGFISGGFATSLALIGWLAHFGNLAFPEGHTLATILAPLMGITVASALVELVPFGDDNVTVPLFAFLVSRWVFGP